MFTADLTAIAAPLVGAAVALVLILPMAVVAMDGLVGWVRSGPPVLLPAERPNREVWIVTDGLDPYRYQTREQVDAANAKRYRRWKRRRAVWRFLYRLVGRRL